MDYLDNKKEFRDRILLYVGYILIAIAIVIATLVLVYQAYGFNLGKNGAVIQNGLVFFSSQPNPASIYINGTLNAQTTNTRLILPSGIYSVKLTRTGYRDWTRTITIDGGAVEHFDYPVLFPKVLTSSNVFHYSSAPGLMTQSPDRRWLIIEKPGSATDFDLYDLKNPKKPVETSLSIPSTLLSKASNSESWQVVQWANDNQHLLLDHVFDGQNEYILLDRNDPTQSVNLNRTFQIGTDQVSLVNKQPDTFYVYDSGSGNLGMAVLNTPGITPVLSHVLAYASYGTDSILYATPDNGHPNKVLIRLKTGGQTYPIRSLGTSSMYLLNLTTYNGTLYVAVGSQSDNRVYIYQDPVGQLQSDPSQAVVPTWLLHVNQPNYLSFSDNAQFIETEDSNSYAVYDIQNNLGYIYTDANRPLDPPQGHATWMDGDRLTYVSHGKLVVQDYDNNNQQTLVSASPGYLPAFSSHYRYLFVLEPTSGGGYDLTQTPLLTPPDM